MLWILGVILSVLIADWTMKGALMSRIYQENDPSFKRNEDEESDDQTKGNISPTDEAQGEILKRKKFQYGYKDIFLYFICFG